MTWIFVSPWDARHGIGTALLDAAVQALLRRGLRKTGQRFSCGQRVEHALALAGRIQAAGAAVVDESDLARSKAGRHSIPAGGHQLLNLVTSIFAVRRGTESELACPETFDAPDAKDALAGIMALVADPVASDVLFDERNRSIGSKLAAERERADTVVAVTRDSAVRGERQARDCASCDAQGRVAPTSRSSWP